MPAATIKADLRSPDPAASRLNQVCWIAALAAGWLWVWRHLSLEWRYNEQYQYGFAVPLLAVYVGWQRWSRLAGAGKLEATAPGWGVQGVIIFGWALFSVGEVLRQHDPGWHLCGGAMMTGITLVTAAWLYVSGGWPLVKAMAFPLGFTWLAMPWPSDVEHFLVTTLTRRLTSLVIFVLNFSSIPALQNGNIIGTQHGFVGIDEACSGVQSFQSGLMAGLFLGEWFRLGVGRRVGLVLGGWVIAFAGNFCRVLTLTLLVSSQGEEAVPKYHDWVGYISTSLIFIGIFTLAWGLGGAGTVVDEGDEGKLPPKAGLPAPRTLPGWEGITLLAGALLVPILAFVWFHGVVAASVMPVQAQPLWSVATNRSGTAWKARPVPLTEVERRMLRYSEGDAWTLRGQEGGAAELYHFFWKPGEGFPSMTYVHTPNICMPNAGWVLEAPAEPVTISVHGVDVHGGLYIFTQGTLREMVFQTIAYGGKTMSTAEDPYAKGTRSERFSMLWRLPHQQISEEMMVFTPASDAGPLDRRMIGRLLEDVLDPAKLKR